jgi:hypothetical protein
MGHRMNNNEVLLLNELEKILGNGIKQENGESFKSIYILSDFIVGFVMRVVINYIFYLKSLVFQEKIYQIF